MRVVFLAAGDNPHTARWVNILSSKGVDVHLVTCADQTPSHDEINPKVALHVLPHNASGLVGYLRNVAAFRDVVRQVQPDVTNAHYASGYGLLARASSAPKTIISVWGSDVYLFPKKSAVHRRLVVGNLRYASALASTSHAMADQVRKLLNEPNKEIAITPFGIDVDRYQAANNASHPDLLTIGAIRNLKTIYGIHHLLRAARLIRASLTAQGDNRRLRLEIYGDGPERDNLERLASELEIGDIVTFHGRVPNERVPDIISRFDVVAMPSESESFGVAAVEAMASGVPVVGTETPGLQEVVRHNRDGVLVPIGDPKALAHAITELLLDPEERRRMGEAGRIRVREEYNFSNNVDTMISLYEQVALYV